VRKHQPMRTCVACRESRPKRELVRVVRSVEGAITIDSSGKLAGRGAYLCPQRSCWELALKRKSLDHALKMTLTAKDIESLSVYAQGLEEEREVRCKTSVQGLRASDNS